MKCWICGDEATTGEHLIKASDLRSYFGYVDQREPIYFHSDKKRNVPVGSVKSNRFMSQALLCAKCNNERTQPYDHAWEMLSGYIRGNWKLISKSKKVDLSKVFPGCVGQQSLNIHLYFVKLFGCRIVEAKVPIDIKKFSDCLLNRCAHDEIFLVLSKTAYLPNHKIAQITEIQARNIGSVTDKAAWIYTLGELSIQVGYLAKTADDILWPQAWHPSRSGKLVKFGKSFYP
jgi:hypothetical protein